MVLRRIVISALVLALAACSAGGRSALPASAPRGASDTAAAQPLDTAGAQPLDTAGAQPLDTAAAQPLDTAGAQPLDIAGAQPLDTAGAQPLDTAGAQPLDTAGAQPLISAVCPQTQAPGSASCLVQRNVSAGSLLDTNPNVLSVRGLRPADIVQLYHLPASGGNTVAIVDAFDNPVVEADLAVYRSTFGLPPCTSQNGCFRKVNQTGGTDSYPQADGAWATEIALDVEMVSAACPACKILLVEANSASLDDLGSAVDEAVTLGARAVSNSYAAPEYSGEETQDVHYNHPGIPMTASSGDGGYGATMYPAASRYVTAVGGTHVTGSPGAYVENNGWTGTGRGCSKYVARPWWQNGSACKTRYIADVGAIADPGVGVAVYDSYPQAGRAFGWEALGGTSVGAPIIAAAYALAGDYAPYNNSARRVYAHRTALFDVPPAGYDLATGLGSPNGVGAF